ncbi:TonB-dependent receptor [Sphingopyxis terrae]|uniref:TonB-dependent receptor n=1 Tax=Sphingopyxis terrae TaxID=33052 RepID=UPI002A110C06|nr:TonB-dependent receptor [Sphingopyxis terrae]MDX8359079.1 TonB-dependent receptor [Sphingopyxis terrae]
MGSRGNLRWALLATAAAQLTPATAFAQSAPDEAAAAAPGDEIVVTARKREESLQDVPISVQAFSSAALERAGIKDFSEVAYRVPGLKLSAERAVDTELFIRGIGSDIQGAGADAAVGIFVDGAYLSRGTGSLLDLYDLERVEVLKGPQALRFGKSVVGGLINYVTKKPGDTFEGRFEATYGNYNRLDVAGSVRGPVSDTLSLGLVASSRSHDGYAKNLRGGDEEDQNMQSVRAQLRWRPTPSLDVNLAADYTRHRDGARWVDILIPGDSEEVTYLGYYAPTIDSLPGFVLPNRNAPFKSADPRSGNHNFTGFQNSDMYGVSGTIDWQAGGGLSVTSQTVYRDSSLKAREDGSGMLFNFPIDPATNAPDISSAMVAGLDTYLATVPDSYFDSGKGEDVTQFSQELRLRWDNGGPLRVEGGAYYLHENIRRAEDVNFLFPDYQAIEEFAFAMAYGGTPATPSPGSNHTVTTSRNDNVGVFGELSYSITDKLTFEAGLRYAYDHKRYSNNRSGVSFEGEAVNFVVGETRSWDAWLPSATLRFEPSDDVTLYARYAKGYKPGGWTGEDANTPAEALVSFDPETANSFEVGAKLALAGRRLFINAAAYYTNYDNLQTNQFLSPGPGMPPDNFVFNAKNGTRAYGLELDFQARITDAFTLSGNYAYSRCNFTGELIIDDEGTDLDGNTCRRTPKHAFNVAANLDQPIADNLVLVLGSDFQYTGANFFDNPNTPILKFDSEILLNARIGLRDADDKWEVTAWAKNLTNELNFTSKLELFGTIYSTYIPPRTYGVTARFRF